MTNEELNTALYQKMFAEQEKYRDRLLSQPPEKVLNHTYEYTVREDILLSLEYNDLSDKQCKALLKSPCLLNDIFKDFEKRETDHMTDIWDTVECRANAMIRQNDEPLKLVILNWRRRRDSRTALPPRRLAALAVVLYVRAACLRRTGGAWTKSFESLFFEKTLANII